MNYRGLIAIILACSAVAMPTGIAYAEGVDIRTDTVRVTIDDDGDIDIVNYGRDRIVSTPYQSQRTMYHRPDLYLRVPQAICRGSSDSYQSSQTSRSSGNQVYTRSSVSTRVCQ